MPPSANATTTPSTRRASVFLMTQTYSMVVAGKRVDGSETFDIRNPYDGALVGTTSWATPEQVEEAVEAAHQLRNDAAALPIHVRAEALAQVSRTIAERLDEIAQLISAENGKPIMWARAEASRAVSVFRIAAEDAAGRARRCDWTPTRPPRGALPSARYPRVSCSRSHRSTSPSIWWPTRWLRPSPSARPW